MSEQSDNQFSISMASIWLDQSCSMHNNIIHMCISCKYSSTVRLTDWHLFMTLAIPVPEPHLMGILNSHKSISLVRWTCSLNSTNLRIIILFIYMQMLISTVDLWHQPHWGASKQWRWVICALNRIKMIVYFSFEWNSGYNKSKDQ